MLFMPGRCCSAISFLVGDPHQVLKQVCEVNKAKVQGAKENIRRIRQMSMLMQRLKDHPDWVHPKSTFLSAFFPPPRPNTITAIYRSISSTRCRSFSTIREPRSRWTWMRRSRSASRCARSVPRCPTSLPLGIRCTRVSRVTSFRPCSYAATCFRWR